MDSLLHTLGLTAPAPLSSDRALEETQRDGDGLLTDFDKLFEGPKRRKKRMRDEEKISSDTKDMLEKMEAAAEADREAHSEANSLPSNKSELVADVDAFMQRVECRKAIVETGLSTLRTWLEPLGKDLPALHVRHFRGNVCLQHMPSGVPLRCARSCCELWRG